MLGSNFKVGIEVVRNAIGVLKDVSEFWVVGPGPIAGTRRYHYQYAVISATPFSSGAQRYAFAQDVHLFPLDRSRYFQPILEAIRSIVPVGLTFARPMIDGPRQFSGFRTFVRQWLRSAQPRQRPTGCFQQIDVRPFVEACRQLNFALVAVLGGRFPVLLTPSRAARERFLEEQVRVRIFWNREGWFLREENSREDLFSFDLPDELFELYAEEGFLNPERALDLKEEMMSSFQTVETREGRTRIINFVLDREWIAAIRRSMD